MTTRQELIAKRNEVAESLIAQGWDEDDAKFATMTAAARPDGILADQSKAEAPELIELANMAKQSQAPAAPKVISGRTNSDNEMEDQ